MILLDFFSGSHGHFLEYVVNTWFFGGPKVPNLFTDLGTCHGIRAHQQYEQQKIVCGGHYSEYNLSTAAPQKIIRISIDSDWGNYIYQINVMSRAGDIPIEKKIQQTSQLIRETPRLYRNEWFSKFNFVENSYSLPGNWRWPDLAAFEFRMEALFDHVEFYQELYRLSAYLQQSFQPDSDLSRVLESFLNKNQGWQYWHRAKLIAQQTLLGNSMSFDSDEILQALINTILSQCVGIYDGVLFDTDHYPTDTLLLYSALHQHLAAFDHKF